MTQTQTLKDEYIERVREAQALGYTEDAMRAYLRNLNLWLAASVVDVPTYYRVLTDITEALETPAN